MPLPKAFAPVFILLAGLGWVVMHGPAAQAGRSVIRPSCLNDENPYRIGYSKWPKVNGLFCILNTLFATILAQPAGKAITSHFLLGLGPLVAQVMGLESSRWYGFPYALMLSVPNVIGMISQVMGGGLILPVYFLVFVLALQPSHKTRPVRPMEAERTLLSTVLGFIIPARNILTNQSPRTLAIFQIFPIICIGVGSLYNVIRRAVPPEDGAAGARASWRNVQIGYLVCAASSLYAHYEVVLPRVRGASLAPMLDLVVPRHSRPFSGPKDVAPNLPAAVIDFLKWDYVLVFAAIGLGALWTMESPTDILVFLGVTAAAGPGAGLSALFYLREKRIVEAAKKAALKGKKSQ